MMFKFRGVEFGGSVGSLIVTGFNPGAAEVRGTDQPRSRRDGSVVGQDFLGNSTWAFDISTNRDDLSGALATAAGLEAAWKDPTVRLAENAAAPLSYELGGRWRRVYGRPGQFVGVSGDVLANQGAAKLVCDFRVTDPLHYDDDDTSVTLTIVPATVGGWTTPFVFPLSTVRSSAPRAGNVTNAGDAPTALKVKFQGPVTDPWVRSSSGLEVGLIGTLAYDQSVTVDPLSGAVTRENGSSAAGLLTRKTRLSSTLLQPGTTVLSFGGTDQTGTATATLSWRNAYTSI